MATAARSEAMQASVLVLNRLYMAVHIVDVRRAFSLLACQHAEVIHLEEGVYFNYSFDSWLEICELRAEDKFPHDDWIRAVNFEIQVPRVIRLFFYDRMPRHAVRLNRQGVLARDGHRCQYCGRRLPANKLSLDHVIPSCRGGMDTWENIVCACLKCNVRKGGRTPREAHMRLIRKPFKPRRSPMLAQKLDSPKYESWGVWLNGLSEIGSVKAARSVFSEDLDACTETHIENVEHIRAG